MELTPQILIVFAVLGAALVLFITEWLRVDVVAVLMVLVLVAAGILEPARAFQGFHPDTISGLLRSARHIERTTRHKMNPNCPTYGDRESLVTAGILTNDIPEV